MSPGYLFGCLRIDGSPDTAMGSYFEKDLYRVHGK